MTARIIKFSLIFLVLFFSTAFAAYSQTSAFNFQGRLNDGSSPANGNYDFQFKLFDSAAGGNQVGSTIEQPNLQLRDGVFSTILNFGILPFLSGDRFLEISVRPGGSSNAYVILGARQQILSAPFAVRATKASNADTAEVANNASLLGGISPTGYVRLNESNTGNLVINGNTQQNGNLSITEVTVVQNVTVGGNSIVNGNTIANGNTIQPAVSLGFAKALLNITGLGVNGAFINRCYNGVTGNAAGHCGFTLTEPLGGVGVYRINFGFPINNRFVVATSEYGGSASSGQNTVPQYRFFNDTTIEFFLTKIESPADTTPFNFMVMVF